MHTIRAYGALLFATVMNTRQFLSILLSCALFGHPLSHGQWRAPCPARGFLSSASRAPVYMRPMQLQSRAAVLGPVGGAACRSPRGQGAWW
jgi:hypothetical protein